MRISDILDFNNLRGVNVADPSTPQDIVNLRTLQAALQGLRWKEPVRTASTANLTLSGAQTVDGAGTDHAWGTFCFVWGGAVIPGHYGTPPNLAVNSADDVGQGRYIPTIATSQVGATIAQWMGVPTINLATMFPTLANFGSPTIPFLP